MSAWAPTPEDVAGFVADRALPGGTFADPAEGVPGTHPTLSWVQERIDRVAARIESLTGGVPAELGALARECVTYHVAADVDASHTAGRQIGQYSRSLEYRTLARQCLERLLESSGGGVTGAGSPAWSFGSPQVPDRPVW